MTVDIDDELHSFVAARYVQLRRTAVLLCGDWNWAEDLVQIALARVVVAARRRSIANLDAYARASLTRVFLDEARRGARRYERPHPQPDLRVTPESDRALALTVLAALKSLPPRQRAAVVLRYWEDRSTEETAALLGVSEGTVKSQCAKGLAALRRPLAQMASEIARTEGASSNAC